MTFDIESVTLIARSYPVPSDPGVVDVVLTAPDGAIEYEDTHYRATARADVLAWARSVGVAVEFSPGFPE